MVPCGTTLNTGWSSLIPQAIVQNEICQLGSETTKYQYFQLSQLLSAYAKGYHGLPYQTPSKSQDTPCRQMSYYLTCA